ncbi:MAG: aminoacylase, partial [Alphaproteobacteria bacterium]|nr:aminoacylase [Alphaproteobacteria bacterium]
LSSGLDYPPAFAAPPEEIIDLARVLTDIGGRVYTSHIRDEGDLVVEALQEALRTGAAAQVRTVISHHKCAGVKNHGRSAETLGLINQVQANGLDVALDVYPYTASATSLIARFVTD